MSATHTRTTWTGCKVEERFDREAAVLRAAALMQELLGQGEPVLWRDVTELCRDLVPKRWPKLAQEVAWEALTTHLDRLEVVWGGEKGQRWMALPPGDD